MIDGGTVAVEVVTGSIESWLSSLSTAGIARIDNCRDTEVVGGVVVVTGTIAGVAEVEKVLGDRYESWYWYVVGVSVAVDVVSGYSDD